MKLLWVQRKHYFELIFLLQLIIQNFLRQRLMIMQAKLVAKNSLILLLIAYWTLHYTKLTGNDQLIQLLTTEMFTIQCILIDFLLILSNMNFLSLFWFWIAFMRFRIHVVFWPDNVSHCIIFRFRKNFKSLYYIDAIWRRRVFNFWYSVEKAKQSKSLLSNCFSMTWV